MGPALSFRRPKARQRAALAGRPGRVVDGRALRGLAAEQDTTLNALAVEAFNASEIFYTEVGAALLALRLIG